MPAATKNRRHLHRVPDLDLTGAPVDLNPDAPLIAATTLARRALFAEQHDTAALASIAPEVVEQQHANVAKAMTAIGKPGADLHAILDDLCRGMYVAGHMDGAAASRQDALAEITLATVTRIDRARWDGGDSA